MSRCPTRACPNESPSRYSSSSVGVACTISSTIPGAMAKSSGPLFMVRDLGNILVGTLVTSSSVREYTSSRGLP